MRSDILPRVTITPPEDLKAILGVVHRGSLHRSVTENEFGNCEIIRGMLALYLLTALSSCCL